MFMEIGKLLLHPPIVAWGDVPPCCRCFPLTGSRTSRVEIGEISDARLYVQHVDEVFPIMHIKRTRRCIHSRSVRSRRLLERFRRNSSFLQAVCACVTPIARISGGGGASSSRIKAGVCLDMYPRRAERRPLEKKKSGYGYVRGRVYPFSLLAVY